jgi:hypothetical protein
MLEEMTTADRQPHPGYFFSDPMSLKPPLICRHDKGRVSPVGYAAAGFIILRSDTEQTSERRACLCGPNEPRGEDRRRQETVKSKAGREEACADTAARLSLVSRRQRADRPLRLALFRIGR